MPSLSQSSISRPVVLMTPNSLSKVGDGKMSGAPTIQEEMVSVLLCQLDMHKSMCPGGIHPTGIRELEKEPKHSQSSASSTG